MSLRTTLCATAVLAALLLCTQANGLTITSASFEADFAELVAHRFVFGFPVNELTLSGPSGGSRTSRTTFSARPTSTP